MYKKYNIQKANTTITITATIFFFAILTIGMYSYDMNIESYAFQRSDSSIDVNEEKNNKSRLVGNGNTIITYCLDISPPGQCIRCTPGTDGCSKADDTQPIPMNEILHTNEIDWQPSTEDESRPLEAINVHSQSSSNTDTKEDIFFNDNKKNKDE